MEKILDFAPANARCPGTTPVGRGKIFKKRWEQFWIELKFEKENRLYYADVIIMESRCMSKR